MEEVFEFDNGKYKIVRDRTTYKTILYRNGENWYAGTSNVLGDKLFHLMLDEISRLKEFEYMYKELCD